MTKARVLFRAFFLNITPNNDQPHAHRSGSAVDRHWNLVAANAALAPMLAGVADRALLEPPVNVLRLSLHPEGLAPRIANLVEWRAHLLDRLRRQIAVTSDPVLADLLRELSTYPVNNTLAAIDAAPPTDHGGVLVPLELVTDAGLLSFISPTTVFGTPRDITLSVLALFPANTETSEILRRLSATDPLPIEIPPQPAR